MLNRTESRRDYNEDFRYEEVKEILEGLFGFQLPNIPHGDSLNYLWKELSIEELEHLKHCLIYTLIRGKYLDSFRFKRTFLIGTDGVEIFRFDKRHCEHCLYAKVGSKGEYQYYHRVLEAKLICANGFSFSICTEFIENAPLDREDKKQDCELKAFYRLAAKLKKLFPRLPMTLLADSLYPKGPVFEICRKNKWHYIFVLQNTVLTTVWEDFEGLFAMKPNALGVQEDFPMLKKGYLRYRWQNDLSYQGEKFDGQVNLMTVEQLNSSGKYEVIRAFITNWKLTQDNVEEIETNGQLRWKIENEGFNIQKNQGYELEHLFSKDPHAMQVVYCFIQIAHLLNQLFVKADLLGCGTSLLSLRHWFKHLLDGLTSGWTQELQQQWDSLQDKKFQVRWDI